MHETWQYRILQTTIIVFGLGVAVALLFVIFQRGLVPVALGERLQDTCGCGSVLRYQPTALATWLSRGIITVAAVMWGRLIFFFSYQIKRGRQRQQDLLARGARRMSTDLQPTNVWVVPGHQPVAMTVGFFRPNIYVSDGLVAVLSSPECQAVIAHEYAHCRARDPLFTAVTEAIVQAYWNIGWLRYLATAGYSLRELAADAAATENYQSIDGLAGAFIKLANQSSPSATIAFSPNQDRLEKLLDTTWRPNIQWWRWRSVPGVLLVVIALAAMSRFSIVQASSVAASLPQSCHQAPRFCPVETTSSILHQTVVSQTSATHAIQSSAD